MGPTRPRRCTPRPWTKGLTVLGFSEHSPRPQGFDYLHEYRDQLTRHLPGLRARSAGTQGSAARQGQAGRAGCSLAWKWTGWKVRRNLRGLPAAAYDFDYLLGSVHFIRNWGFDDGAGPWKAFSQEECEARYQAYFTAWEQMLSSGLFNIAAHPDLIKIFSVEQFHIWLAKPESLATASPLSHNPAQCRHGHGDLLRRTAQGLSRNLSGPSDHGAGSRAAAAVSFASDAHSSDDVAYGFARLASYAKAFGFTEHVIFEKGRMTTQPF